MDESAHLRGLLTQLNTLGGKNGPVSKQVQSKNEQAGSKHKTTKTKKHASDDAHLWNAYPQPNDDEWEFDQSFHQPSYLPKPRVEHYDYDDDHDDFDPHADVPFPPLTPQQRAELDRQRAAGFPMTDKEKQEMERATAFELALYERHLHEERAAALRRDRDEQDDRYYTSHARSGAAAGPRRH